MTVKELIKELSLYPEDIEVTMTMKVDVHFSIGEGNRNTHTTTIYPCGKVFGVQGSVGTTREVKISGS